MRRRVRAVSLSAIATLILVLSTAAASASVGHGASVPSTSHVAAAQTCATVDGITQTSAQAAAAERFWTQQEMQDSTPFSQAALAKIIARLTPAQRRAAERAGRPATVQETECTTTGSLPTSAAATAATGQGNAPQSVGHTSGYRTVGKFFYNVDILGVELPFNCTATAINDQKVNAARALVLTAAHCFFGDIDGYTYESSDWTFAPGWYATPEKVACGRFICTVYKGHFPYGSWSVKAAYYPKPWRVSCGSLGQCKFNPQYDYAAFLVDPKDGHGVGWYVGDDGWNDHMAKTEKVTIFGQPGCDTCGKLLTNTTVSHTVTTDGYLSRTASTPGFLDGVSGGPWFYSYSWSSQLGLILGDIGGYEQGGPTSGSPSYSPFWTSYFGGFIAAVAEKE
jgi:hypothetical protein